VGIHIRKKGRELPEEAVREIAQTAKGYSGAEIESAVENALWKCYATKEALTKEKVIESIKETKPLSDTMGGELKQLKEWAKGRVRYASSQIEEKVKKESVQEFSNIEVDDE